MLFDNNVAHLVEKHKWKVITKKLGKFDASQRQALAEACGNSSDEDALNTLILLLEDVDANVMMETVKSLGKVGGTNAKSHLLFLHDNLPDEKDDVKKEIMKSIEMINKSNRR